MKTLIAVAVLIVCAACGSNTPATSGTNGVDGATGPQGPQGPQGPPGSNGSDTSTTEPWAGEWRLISMSGSSFCTPFNGTYNGTGMLLLTDNAFYFVATGSSNSGGFFGENAAGVLVELSNGVFEFAGSGSEEVLPNNVPCATFDDVGAMTIDGGTLSLTLNDSNGGTMSATFGLESTIINPAAKTLIAAKAQ